MAIRLIEEKKEISDKDIKDIVISAMEMGSINFNVDLYSEEEMTRITTAFDEAYNNIKNAVSQVNHAFRVKYPNASHRLRKKNNAGKKNVRESFEFIRSKSVTDSDGFLTDYTLYKVQDDTYYPDGGYVCIFGDNDLYDPDNTEPDMEFDNEDDAIDWFNNYDGIE